MSDDDDDEDDDDSIRRLTAAEVCPAVRFCRWVTSLQLALLVHVVADNFSHMSADFDDSWMTSPMTSLARDWFLNSS